MDDIKYTAFIDVLGFSNYNKANIKNDVDAEEFYRNLQLVIDYFKNLKQEKFDELGFEFLINYTWVSDTFVLTMEYTGGNKNEETASMLIYILSIAIAQVHHFFAKEYNLLIRGAVSSKYTFINDRILLGEGISEAHYLESKIAVNPRVIFSECIITENILKDLSLNYSDNDLNVISKDDDGYYFINYLSVLQEIPPMIGVMYGIQKEKLAEKALSDTKEILEKYHYLIKEGLLNENTEIKSKYMWLKKYCSKVLLNAKFEIKND